MGKKIKAFISYEHRDEAWTRRFVTGLKGQGFDVWFDREQIDPTLKGRALGRAIYAGLQSSDILVRVISERDFIGGLMRLWRGDWLLHEHVLAYAFNIDRIFGVAHGDQTAEAELNGWQELTKDDPGMVKGSQYVGHATGAEAADAVAARLRELCRQRRRYKNIADRLLFTIQRHRKVYHETFSELAEGGPLLQLRRIAGMRDDDEG